VVAQVLVVCTANIARSPLAAAVLDAHVRLRGLQEEILVTSAGVRARIGDRAAGPSMAVAERMGLDLGGHRSIPVSDDLVAASHLIITMTEEHRDELSGRAAKVASRCFTLRELGRLAADIDVDDLPEVRNGRVSEVSRRAHLRRAFSAIADTDDVRDPFGGDDRGYVELAKDLVDILGPVTDTLLGPRPRVMTDPIS
jgi:protein-tyrosine phosphatase